MDENKSIINDALIYYDEHTPRINKFLERAYYIRFENPTDSLENNAKILFFDKHKKKIFESRMQYAGIYIPNTKTFKWAWSVPVFAKSYTALSKKLFDYGYGLETEYDYQLKTELLNSKIKINTNYQLDIYVSLLSYLCKMPFILKYYNAIVDDEDYLRIRCDGDDCKDYITTYIFIMDF